MRIKCQVYASEFGGQTGYLLARGDFYGFTLRQPYNKVAISVTDARQFARSIHAKFAFFCLKSYCPNLNMPQIIRKKDRSSKKIKWRESAFIDFRLQVD